MRVIRVPRMVSQWIKNGWEKLDLIPITYQMGKRQGVFATVLLAMQEHTVTRTYLVVDVMIISVVGASELEGVPRKPVAAVVVDGLERGYAEKEHGLAGA